MSVHLSDLVWRRSAHKGSELLVLLSIADNGDWSTGQAYPSIEHIAAKTRLSKGGVHAILTKLLDGDELAIVKKGKRGSATLYRIEIGNIQQKSDRLESLKVQRSNESSNGFVQSKPGISSLASAHQPSVEPSGSSSSETASPQKDERDDEVKVVFDCWQVERKCPKKRLTAGRRKKIATRLKTFTVDELCDAIRAVAFDPWPERKFHDDLITILRSDEQVEKFLAFSQNGSRMTRRDRDNELRQQIAEHHQKGATG